MVTTVVVPKRRIAFGALLSEAPWDGRAKSPALLRIPATVAARVAAPAPQSGRLPAPKQRKRLPFGQLLASAPWKGPRPAPADAPTPEA